MQEPDRTDQPMRLAIVGSRELPAWWMLPAASGIIGAVLNRYHDRIQVVISGGAPGIDTLAANIASDHGLQVVVHQPEFPRWEPQGYKERNLVVARDCTDLLCIRYGAGESYGSGWTADRAEEMGRQVQRVVF